MYCLVKLDGQGLRVVGEREGAKVHYAGMASEVLTGNQPFASGIKVGAAAIAS
jgi:hypothetical protein